MVALQDKLKQQLKQPNTQNTSSPSEKVVTVELSPPKGVDVSKFVKRASSLKDKVDAINVPDCQLSILKMSSLAAAKVLLDSAGVDVVWQLSCRDRNLIALQADLMGAYALGIQTVLALTGDPVQVGDHQDIAKQVFHLESVRLLSLISQLNQGRDATGKELKSGGTHFTVGAALNPFRLHNQAQQKRLRQKLDAGVTFFQTQPVYDIESTLRTIETLQSAIEDVGCPRPALLIGIIPPKHAKIAKYMNDSVAGIQIPDSLVRLLESAQDPATESIAFCADLMEKLKPHVEGFHIMPVAMESRVEELLQKANLVTQEPALS